MKLYRMSQLDFTMSREDVEQIEMNKTIQYRFAKITKNNN